MTILTSILFVVFCGFCGSLNGALLVRYCLGLPDLRLYGSGNPGATNATRAYGLWAGIIVFLIDSSKVFYPMLAAKNIFTEDILGFGLCFCILGHCFSPWLNFQGGKGVATLMGGILALNPSLGLCSLGLWLGVYGITRLSALSALMMITFILGAQSAISMNIGTVLALSIVFLRHAPNWKLWNRFNELKKQ